jgi:hypothetical protein
MRKPKGRQPVLIGERGAARRARLAELEAKAARKNLEARGVLVNEQALKPYNSYGCPDFVQRGYYEDMPFKCQACGVAQIWTATQQKWWYEVAKGDVYSAPKLCRPCRRKEQARRAEARRVHLEGLARKKQQRGK